MSDDRYESSDEEVSTGSGYVGDSESENCVTDDESEDMIKISALKQNDELRVETQGAVNFASSLEREEDEKLLMTSNDGATNHMIEEHTKEAATASEDSDDSFTG